MNCRVLICCTCHFWSSSHFIVYFGFLCLQLSSVSNFCPDTRGEGRHLFRLTCSVLLWGRRDTANKYHWHVWGVLAVDGPHWVCYGPRWCVFPGSTLLRLQGAPPGYCPKWTLCFMHFPGPGHSGNWGLGESTVQDRPCFLCSSPGPGNLVSWVCWNGTVPGFPSVSSGELISGCNTLVDVICPGSQEDVVINWQLSHSLVEDVVSGAMIVAASWLLALAVTHLPLCLQGGRALNGRWLALFWYLLGHNPLLYEPWGVTMQCKSLLWERSFFLRGVAVAILH